jgi:membrane-bound ClpP family serine protease
MLFLLAAILAAAEPVAPEPRLVQDPVPASAPAPAAEGHRVAYIPIDGEIDEQRATYYKHAVAAAVAAHVDTVVVHLTTNGGLVSAGSDMMATAMGVAKPGPRMVAFIDHHSYSAGSLIAYGHDEIWLTERATLGDIGVIMQGSDGGITYGPEKIETVVRTLLRGAAQNKGWNEAKLVKMTARNQDLYRFDGKAGPVFVLEDDLPRFLADHPDVDGSSKVVLLGHDRLLSYTAHDAVQEHMATGMVAGLDALYAHFGTTSAQVLDLSPSRTEEIAWKLAGFAPMLAAAAVFFLVMEFKAPGVGLWLALAAICGAGFFVCQYYQDLAGSVELILLVLGVLAVMTELLFFPTGGWLALLGVAMGATGLVLSFMPDIDQFNPSSPAWGGELLSALLHSSLALVAMIAGAVFIVIALPNLAVMHRLAATAEIGGTSAGEAERHAAQLVGRRVTVRTALSPGGFVVVDGRDLGASSEHGEYVAVGTTVEIVAMRYGEAVVRLVAEAPGPAAAAPGAVPT